MRSFREALERLEGLPELAGRPPRSRAGLLATLDRFDEAVPLAREANARLRELDGRRFGEWRLAEIASLQDDHEAAAAHLRELCERLDEQGLLGQLSTYVSYLGRDQLCELGRYEEADALARRGHELAEETDATGVRRLAAGAGSRARPPRRIPGGGTAARARALAITEDTDGLNDEGEALRDLAEILLAAGRDEEVVGTDLLAALERFERKENIPTARRTRTRLMALRVGTSSV